MKFERIPIHKVDLDRQNPRITQFQSAEQSFDTNEESNDWLQNILLQPHGSEEYGPNADELQKSIRAAGTILREIHVLQFIESSLKPLISLKNLIGVLFQH